VAWQKRIQEGSSSLAVCDTQGPHYFDSADGVFNYILQCRDPHLQWHAYARLRYSLHIATRIFVDLGRRPFALEDSNVPKPLHQSQKEPLTEYKNIPDLGLDEHLSRRSDHGAKH
jgi:hypothetical protein